MSTWYTRYDRVCQDLANWADDDIYTCVGLPHTDPPLAKRIRGKAEQVTAIAGMWADVDIVHPLHKKTNLPPNMEKAVELLESLPLHTNNPGRLWPRSAGMGGSSTRHGSFKATRKGLQPRPSPSGGTNRSTTPSKRRDGLLTRSGTSPG